ncbi:Fis family transcriptional regulator, partial [Rhodococcus wratislaviensis IFP 2016]
DGIRALPIYIALPVIDRLTADMSDVPVTIALTDAHARIVHRRDCSTAVGRLLDRVDFLPGFSFEENGVGTNGIGTVFEAGAPISVVGPAHFNEALVPFACTGAPVHNPVTGRIEGVLDVSLLSETWTPLIHALVKTAAADISRNLLQDRSQAERTLFEAYINADLRPRQAVMAVGSSVMVNRRAQALFTPEELFTILQHARYLSTDRVKIRLVDSITLASGRSVRLRAKLIQSGSELAGIVLLLDEELPHSRVHFTDAVGDSADPAMNVADGPTCPLDHQPQPDLTTVADGYSPTWNRTTSDMADALVRQANVIVIGEPGTGKSTLVAEQFHHVYPSGRTISVDADRVKSENPIRFLDAGGSEAAL